MKKQKNRVLANLNSDIQNSQLIRTYLEYIEKHKIKQALNLVLSFFGKQNIADQYQLLKVYNTLEGDLEKLHPLLDKSDRDFRNTLIEQYIRANSPSIKKYLKQKFRLEKDPNDKIVLSRYLIRLQDKEGLLFYIKYLKECNYAPDDSSSINPIYTLNKPKFTWVILDLYQLSLESKYCANPMYDLRTISANALQNIALYKNNFPKVQLKIKLWILKTRFFKINKTKNNNLIKDIRHYMENFEKQYYITNVVMLTHKEAKLLYSKIIKEI